MKVGYLDASVAVAMAFDDAGGAFMARAVRSFDRLYSAAILETELMGAVAAEGDPAGARRFLSPVRYVFPDTPLGAYALRVLEAGPLSGAALHHLATALYLFPEPEQAYFITADEAQGKVAAALGFQTEFM